MKKIVLASASPRRKELMALITTDYEVITADVDERSIENSLQGKPANYVAASLARAKAQAVYDTLSDSDKKVCAVIGADTSVIIDDKILGKPSSKENARNMLTSLSGRTHSVVTGVAIVTSEGVDEFVEESIVEFSPLDEYQKNLIERYINTDEPYDKAGGYGIQQGGALLVKSVSGDYFNVVGLPVMKLARKITDL
ncbi:MAG: Maf family protein [Saccharofermentans sp.]|nr:Maf family protein [Saccharofermentans sp.]